MGQGTSWGAGEEYSSLAFFLLPSKGLFCCDRPLYISEVGEIGFETFRRRPTCKSTAYGLPFSGQIT
jgi:hypothetical protein